MNNQILKTIKGLKTFTIEDVELITDCCETEILEVIDSLNLIEKNGVYSFEKMVKKKTPRKTASVGKNIFFKNYAKRYVETLNCQEATKRGYEIYLRLHIVPMFENKRIIDLNSNDIELFKKIKLREGLSNKTINNIITFLYSIFESAISHELIRKNPCRNISKLETCSHKKELTEKQINILLDKAKEKAFWLYVLILTAIETGLSRGQILDLTWDDVDYGKKLVKSVKISGRIIDELLKWQSICPENSLNLIFPSQNGTKMCGNNLSKYKFKPICKKAKLNNIRFIDLKSKIHYNYNQ